MKLKKFIAGLVAMLLLATIPQPAFSAPYLPIIPALDYSQNFAVEFSENHAANGEGSSIIYGRVSKKDAKLNGGAFGQFICNDGYGKLPCNLPETYNIGQLIAPVCDTAEQINCIVSLSFVDQKGQPEPAKFIREIDGDRISAKPQQNLTEGSTQSLWSSSTLHGGGTGNYSVYVSLGLTFSSKTKRFSVTRLAAQVQPYNELTGDFKKTSAWEVTTKDGNTIVEGTGIPRQCFWVEDGLCGRIQDFSTGTRLKLELRLANTVGGWFKGRMADPIIDVRRFSNSANSIVIEAEPVVVPMTTVVAKKDSTDPGVVAFLRTQPQLRKFGGVMATRTDLPNSVTAIDQFRNQMNDTASGLNTIWSVGTAPNAQVNNKCLADKSKVLGLVTTNAMAYDGTSPKFSGGFLQYQLSGFHYLPDGVTAFKGKYDLVMRSDVARCLYKFSNAPISATVSVTGGSDKTVATTVVSEKNGWLKLAAYGFTFSQKTIKVKIVKKKK